MVVLRCPMNQYRVTMLARDNDTNTSVKASMDVVRQRLISIQRSRKLYLYLDISWEKDSLLLNMTIALLPICLFDTSPDGGYAVYPNISIEQVNVVKVKVTQAEADKIIPTTVAGQGTGTAGKGNVSGTKGTVSTEEREKATLDMNTG